MRNLKYITVLLWCLTSTYVHAQQDGTIDDAGDIAFIAWSSSNQDGYAFVLLDDCPTGTTIKFIDEEWTGSGFYSSSGEGENTWTNNTGDTIEKGQVIVIENADNNPTCNLGSVSETDAGFDIASSSPDQIFAIVGSRASPTFLAMIGHTSLPNNGTGAIQTLSGTGLVSGTSAIHLTGEALYDGSTSCNCNISTCLQMIHKSSDWKVLSSSVKFPQDVDSLFDGTVLPVTLIDFSYTRENDRIVLHWVTASEVNNYGFDVQRKTANTEWETIDFVKGTGNTSQIVTYHTVDFFTQNDSTYFYRLKQIDFDGLHDYSLTLKVRKLHSELKPTTHVHQKGRTIAISATQDQMTRVQVWNIMGHVLSDIEPKSSEVVYIPPSGNPEMYLVFIYYENRVEVQKLYYTSVF